MELDEKEFAPVSKRGNSHKHSKRIIVNAILYVVRGGIQWRLMPNDFPLLADCLRSFSLVEQAGCLGEMPGSTDNLPSPKTGRCAVPRYGIIDAQSVKTQYSSEERGIDGGKRAKGHKRHIVVDILGNLLHIKVHAANPSDTKSACGVLEGVVDKYPSPKAFSGDAGYRGTAVDFATHGLDLALHISGKIEGKWVVLPKQWVVERAFSWLGNLRRLSKDFEILPGTAECRAFIPSVPPCKASNTFQCESNG